jgi:radical SAM protein with 4Fe4S-binding SPASM domain
LIDHGKFPYKIGFDSCTIPAIHNHSKRFIILSIEPCEATRFACSISSELMMTPFSFGTEFEYGVSLKENTIQKAWNCPTFDDLRNVFHKAPCKSCNKYLDCLGGCPIIPSITICDKKPHQENDTNND